MQHNPLPSAYHLREANTDVLDTELYIRCGRDRPIRYDGPSQPEQLALGE